MKTLFFIFFWGVAVFIVARFVKDRLKKRESSGEPFKTGKHEGQDPWELVRRPEEVSGQRTEEVRETRCAQREKTSGSGGTKGGGAPAALRGGLKGLQSKNAEGAAGVEGIAAAPAKTLRMADFFQEPGATGIAEMPQSIASPEADGARHPVPASGFTQREALSPAPVYTEARTGETLFPGIRPEPFPGPSPSREPLRGNHVGYLPLPGANGQDSAPDTPGEKNG